MEYITVKLPRNKLPSLRHFKAQLMLKGHTNITDAEALSEAINIANDSADDLASFEETKRLNQLIDLARNEKNRLTEADLIKMLGG